MPCHVVLHLCCPAVGPAAQFFACYSSHKRPSLSDTQELVGEGRLHNPMTTSSYSSVTRHCSTESDKPNSVRRAAYLLHDEPVRFYVALLMHPCVMPACHSRASRHLGTTRTLRILERYYWWFSVSVYSRWELRHCWTCQARKIPRLTVRRPIISMPLPEGRGVAVSVNYFAPLLATPRGNTYILLFINRFSHRADIFSVTAAEFTAEGTANILVNQFIPVWGCPRTILSDNGWQFCSKLSEAIYQLLVVQELATISYHPTCNGALSE